MEQLKETERLLAEQGGSKSAKDVLAAVEGGANTPAVPGGVKPKKDQNEFDMTEGALQAEQERRLEEDRKRKAAQYERWYGRRNSALF
jgi:hypothetical protein